MKWFNEEKSTQKECSKMSGKLSFSKLVNVVKLLYCIWEVHNPGQDTDHPD
jgi:hypothetical protein